MNVSAEKNAVADWSVLRVTAVRIVSGVVWCGVLALTGYLSAVKA
jgi:hypothetical protein